MGEEKGEGDFCGIMHSFGEGRDGVILWVVALPRYDKGGINPDAAYLFAWRSFVIPAKAVPAKANSRDQESS